jgi:hypothetical protein
MDARFCMERLWHTEGVRSLSPNLRCAHRQRFQVCAHAWLSLRVRRQGDRTGWDLGAGAGAGRAGQGAGGPCRELGVEGATDRVKRLAPRRFFARLGVACVGNRDVGSTFPFLVGRLSDVSFPIANRLLCDASVCLRLP